MNVLHIFGGFILGFEMPVPIYWLILHPGVNFWRRHVRASYLIAVFCAWGIGDGLLVYFREPLFHGVAFPAGGPSPSWQAAGVILMFADVLIFSVAEMELGGRRLVGHAELTGTGEITTRGLYMRVRHPRYLGMILAVLGACLFFATRALWTISALWLLLTLGTIQLEERELRRRFGSAYAEYARNVPALLPFPRRAQGGART